MADPKVVLWTSMKGLRYKPFFTNRDGVKVGIG